MGHRTRRSAKPHWQPPAGTLVQTQFWYRDTGPSCQQCTSLSDALEFVAVP